VEQVDSSGRVKHTQKETRKCEKQKKRRGKKRKEGSRKEKKFVWVSTESNPSGQHDCVSVCLFSARTTKRTPDDLVSVSMLEMVVQCGGIIPVEAAEEMLSTSSSTRIQIEVRISPSRRPASRPVKNCSKFASCEERSGTRTLNAQTRSVALAASQPRRSQVDELDEGKHKPTAMTQPNKKHNKPLRLTDRCTGGRTHKSRHTQLGGV